MTPREAAYVALYHSLKQESFIQQFLDKWQKEEQASALDMAFAFEIAAGSSRMALTLDYIASQLSDRQKLSLKLKEKALLRTALYQHYFMQKVPLYAITNESVRIAKKYCHSTFVSFLNAVLRKLPSTDISLPRDHSSASLSIKYSYPQFLVDLFIQNYGLPSTITILETGDTPPTIMARVRYSNKTQLPQEAKMNFQDPLMVEIGSPTLLKQIAASPNFYIQNYTPAHLIHALTQVTPSPKSILDLCSSPGGKIIAAHDSFPTASLFANDVSSEKVERLSANLAKYNISTELTCERGENYVSTQKFDLIILDVPCSNSGVLNKRPEARWRINPQSLEELKNTQQALLSNALKLLSPQWHDLVHDM